MKLSRTTNYNFGWLLLIGLVDLAFLLVFFLLLSSNFILQQGVSVSMPFSRFTLGPQTSRQIISITGGAVPAIYFQDQRVTMEELGPLLDAAKRRDESIIIKADRSTSYETVADVANAALAHGINSVALAFTTRRPQETKLRALPKAEHVPSYSAIEPTLKNIPPAERDLRIPSCQPPGAVHFARQKTAPPLRVVKTFVSFSNDLKTFGA